MGNQCTHAPLDHFWEINIRNWTPAHVYTWLCSVDNGVLQQVAITFKKHKINGVELIALSADDKRLQKMNIAIGDRLHFKQELQALLRNRNLSSIPETSSITSQPSAIHNKHSLQCTQKVNQTPIKPTLAPQHPVTMITHASINPTTDSVSSQHSTYTKHIHLPLTEYTHYNKSSSLIPTHDASDNEQNEDSSDENMPSKNELQLPKLETFNRSLPSIQKLVDMISHSTSNRSTNHFVMLDSPTRTSNDEDVDDNDSSTIYTDIEEDEECVWQIKEDVYDTYHRPIPTFPVGPRPGLINMASNKSTTSLIHRAIGANISNVPNDDDEFNGSMVMMKGYDEDDDDDDDGYFENENMNYFTEEEDSYPLPSAIHELTTYHHTTLFMLQTTKQYLLSGYLRNEGIHKIMHIPHAITDVVLDYFDDSSMEFDIKIAELLDKSNGFNKLEGSAFKFHLNMDHKIKLRPTLRHKIRTDINHIMQENIDEDCEIDGIHEFNEIELSLECEALPIKIDKCMVLINILCQCHEIKYQKMELYVFGTDLLGDNNDNNFNLLNKTGLKMIIPKNDITNLNELQFKINATILDIEYDPSFDNYGVLPCYNSSLAMSKSIRFVWELNQRILSTLSRDVFKQKFYSNHFDREFWCLSCYKHDDGQLVLQLNLLRLQSDIASIDCHSIITLRNNQQIIWNRKTNHHMDCQYNNSFKWKLDKMSTNKLFRITDSKLINDDYDLFAPNITIDIQIEVDRMNSKSLKCQQDIYQYLSMQ